MPTAPVERQKQAVHEERWTLLEHINCVTDKPMIVLSFVWLGLVILDLTHGLSRSLQLVSYAIWALFVLDFVIEITIAPDKKDYLRANWLLGLSLLLPALGALRVVRVVRLMRAANAARSLSLLRLLTSVNQGLGAVRHSLGRRGVGYVFALTTIITLAGAAAMYYFESPTALRQAGYADLVEAGGGLHSYGEAVWWTAMIMATIGSDYWPKTAEGRLLSLLLALYAFAVFGYITATVASYFVGQDVAVGQAESPAGDAADRSTLSAELAALQSVSAQLLAESAALRGEVAALRAAAPASAGQQKTQQANVNGAIPRDVLES